MTQPVVWTEVIGQRVIPSVVTVWNGTAEVPVPANYWESAENAGAVTFVDDINTIYPSSDTYADKAMYPDLGPADIPYADETTFPRVTLYPDTKTYYPANNTFPGTIYPEEQ